MTSTERTNRPSLLALAWLLAVLIGILVGYQVFGPVGIFIGALCTLSPPFANRGRSRRWLGDDPEQQPATFEWFFAKTGVTHPFEVAGTTLTYRGKTLELRDADIRASEAGVFLFPASGEPVELYWDEAELAETTALADALGAVAKELPGTQDDIPVALRRLGVANVADRTGVRGD